MKINGELLHGGREGGEGNGGWRDGWGWEGREGR